VLSLKSESLNMRFSMRNSLVIAWALFRKFLGSTKSRKKIIDFIVCKKGELDGAVGLPEIVHIFLRTEEI